MRVKARVKGKIKVRVEARAAVTLLSVQHTYLKYRGLYKCSCLENIQLWWYLYANDFIASFPSLWSEIHCSKNSVSKDRLSTELLMTFSRLCIPICIILPHSCVYLNNHCFTRKPFFFVINKFILQKAKVAACIARLFSSLVVFCHFFLLFTFRALFLSP